MASQVANLSTEQVEKMRRASSQVVDTLADVMQKTHPTWNNDQSALNARTLLWLVDGFLRSEFTREKSVVKSEELLAFYKRGAGIL